MTSELIAEAVEFLRPRIRRTPVEPSPALERLCGRPVWLKLESLQITGSFKVRGAWFRLSRLTAEERRTGVSTCSAGNHGKAVAYAARELGIETTIFVPSSVDRAKHDGMLELGAEVRVSPFPGYDDTLAWAQEQARHDGKLFLSAFDDPWIMAGNGGSLAQEVLEQAPHARTFLLPVGGGGLAAGFAFLVRERYPDATIVGCQLAASPGLQLSLERGVAVTRLPAVETLAGGLEGGLGAQPFELLRNRIDRVALLTEEEIYQAVRWLIERHQYLVEPSAVVTAAALLTGKAGPLPSPAVVVLGGRNISLTSLGRIMR